MPREFKTILCGTDFTERSYTALDYALRFAKLADGTLIVAHFVHVPTGDIYDARGMAAHLRGGAARARRQLLDRAARQRAWRAIRRPSWWSRSATPAEHDDSAGRASAASMSSSPRRTVARSSPTSSWAARPRSSFGTHRVRCSSCGKALHEPLRVHLLVGARDLGAVQDHAPGDVDPRQQDRQLPQRAVNRAVAHQADHEGHVAPLRELPQACRRRPRRRSPSACAPSVLGSPV